MKLLIFLFLTLDITSTFANRPLTPGCNKILEATLSAMQARAEILGEALLTEVASKYMASQDDLKAIYLKAAKKQKSTQNMQIRKMAISKVMKAANCE